MLPARVTLSTHEARRLWIRAQRLDRSAPFGQHGALAARSAIRHLGYVQIDTINVIERCHHHILFTRIPGYRRSDLHQLQSIDKTVFEYWTHALAYVAAEDYRYFMPDMLRIRKSPGSWFRSVKSEELKKVLRLVKEHGALSIREIQDDIPVKKEHAWASRKPSKKALELAFYGGHLTISERIGMLKKYELTERHFNWERRPNPASEAEINDYLIARSLRSQRIVSLDSICHLDPKRKPAIHKLLDQRVKKGDLVPVQIPGLEKTSFWTSPKSLEVQLESTGEQTHLLSPFDPLVIQRKRLQMFFNYEHRFEAYIPKQKRVFGYFALPVLIGDRIVAAIDLKTDRAAKKLLVQKWTWIGKSKSTEARRNIEEALHRFEQFQLDKK